MNGINSSLSTHQASELLGIHESSVKRLCNANELDCWLTPGGHRRIPISALVAFAETQNILLPLRHFNGCTERVWDGLERARKDDFDALSALCYDWLDEGHGHRFARLLEYLLSEQFPLGRLFDRIVSPVMGRVGEGYQQGTLSIGDEHRITQAMRDALITLRLPKAAPASNDGPTAIVGCMRGEVHELGALMVRRIVENTGRRVIYLGLNVPTEEYAAQQARYGADLVCISIMPPMGLVEAQTTARLLEHMYNPARPYRLALGGSALGSAKAPPPGTRLLPVRTFGAMEPFNHWLKE